MQPVDLQDEPDLETDLGTFCGFLVDGKVPGALARFLASAPRRRENVAYDGSATHTPE